MIIQAMHSFPRIDPMVLQLFMKMNVIGILETLSKTHTQIFISFLNISECELLENMHNSILFAISHYRATKSARFTRNTKNSISDHSRVFHEIRS